MSLKRKLYTPVFVVGLIMIIVVLFNVGIANFFMDDVKVIMDDIDIGNQMRENFGNEVKLFKEYMHNMSDENEKALSEACEKTGASLETLPFEYNRIGEERYALTWSIRNSYEQYCKQRDKVISVNENQVNYIEELYTVYNMQDYIQRYITNLNDAIVTDSIDYYEHKTQFLRQMPFVLITVSGTTFVLLFIVVRVLTRSMIEVLSQLVEVSKCIEKNDYTVPDVTWEEHDEIGQLVCAFNKMKHTTGDYIRTIEEMQQMQEKLYRQELEKATLEQKFSMAQLQLLKSQMNPHFLFNTLNMITRMSQLEEAQITEEMLIALSNLLRYSLRTTEPFAPLEQEIKVVEDYMYIQRKRFGDRVQWEITCQVDAAMEEVPVFLLQPLVENAIMHGISVKEEGGRISIRIYRKEEELHIEVEDTGMGIPPERLEQIRAGIVEKGSGLGIGLGNIYRRIAAYYEKGRVDVDSSYGRGTVVAMTLGERK